MKMWRYLAVVISSMVALRNPKVIAQSAYAGRGEDCVQVDTLFGPSSVWEMTPEMVEKNFASAGFRWTSDKTKTHGAIRPSLAVVNLSAANQANLASGKQSTVKLKLFDGAVDAEQVDLEFKDNKLSSVVISIWNKGDAKKLSEKEFFERVAKLKGLITTRVKTRMQELGKDSSSASGAFVTKWETDHTEAQLDYSTDGKKGAEFHGEFIRLRFIPRPKRALGSEGNSNVAKVNLSELGKNVKRTETNDVYVSGIPMVDQGEKGYCALASSERIFRYFGIQCDQHDLAQASESNKRGTKPAEFEEALHKLQGKFKVRVKDIITWGEKDYTKFTEAYNREAKKVGAKQCPPSYFITTFSGLDPVALRATRAKGGGFEKFKNAVVDSIQKGVPLLWGLELGIFPESGQKAAQTTGGHMRLIIGFNETDEELIFSDSWGAGHEFKRMKIRDAFSVTSGLYTIEPTAR